MHTHEQSSANHRKQRYAVTQQPQRDAAQQRTRDKLKSILRHSTVVTALKTPAAMHAQDAHCASSASSQCALHHSRDVHILAVLANTPHTYNLASAALSPVSHHAHPRTRRHTRRDTPHPARRYVRIMTRVTQNSARQQATHGAHDTQTQHTNTHATHAHRTSRTATTTAHCPNITTRTPPHARHTRGLRATLTADASVCPASTGCCRRVGGRSSPTACMTHEQPSRHSMAPADPSQPPATHLSVSHSINQIQ
jgi:hypothetical protein